MYDCKPGPFSDITDEGLSTREETLRNILQQACNSATSKIAETGQDQPVQIGIPETLHAVGMRRRAEKCSLYIGALTFHGAEARM